MITNATNRVVFNGYQTLQQNNKVSRPQITFSGDKFEKANIDETLAEKLLERDASEWRSTLKSGLSKTKVEKTIKDPQAGKVTVILNAKSDFECSVTDGYSSEVVGKKPEAVITYTTKQGDYRYNKTTNPESPIFKLARKVAGEAEYLRLEKMCSQSALSQSDYEQLAERLLDRKSSDWGQPLTDMISRCKATRTINDAEFGKVKVALNAKSATDGSLFDGYTDVVGKNPDAIIEFYTPGGVYHYFKTQDPDSPVFKLVEKAIGEKEANRIKGICAEAA